MKRINILLGSGYKKRRPEGWTHVDRIPFPNVNVVHDLEDIPWPFDDGCAQHISAVHILEHINNVPAFMDECWRLLYPGGTLYVVVPDVNDQELAYCDPTHVHYFRPHTFINYFTLEGKLKFGYVKHAWSILYLNTDGHVIRCHMMPLPPEAEGDGRLRRLLGMLEKR